MHLKYWLAVFTGRTWEEFLASGAEAMGFRLRRMTRVEKIDVGDRMLCYVSGVSRWIGMLDVTGEARLEGSRVFASELFPVRVPVRVLLALPPEDSVRMSDIITGFSWWDESQSDKWGARFQSPPSRIQDVDAALVSGAMERAARTPGEWPIDEKKWAATPRR